PLKGEFRETTPPLFISSRLELRTFPAPSVLITPPAAKGTGPPIPTPCRVKTNEPDKFGVDTRNRSPAAMVGKRFEAYLMWFASITTRPKSRSPSGAVV